MATKSTSAFTQANAFATESDRAAFRTLLGVSSVGPKTAISVLRALPADDLARAIAAKDVTKLPGIPGIGKKTAERIVLELKEKIGGESEVAISSAAGTSSHLIARDALVELGYTVVEAEQALATVDPELPAEERIRLALRSG